MKFTRRLDDHIIQLLQENELFKNYLAPDITMGYSLEKDGELDDVSLEEAEMMEKVTIGDEDETQQSVASRVRRKKYVFPAIRQNNIDFYYGGSKLFSFNGKEFQTHHKFASVLFPIPEKDQQQYIMQHALPSGGSRLILNFMEGYERIKDNCQHYSGLEAQGVSALYEKFSWAIEAKDSGVIVLDIEISFGSESDNKKQDRLDFLCLDLNSKTLKFFEAKHFVNSELRASGNNLPKIVSQISRYSKQLHNNEQEIMDSYSTYVQAANKLFPVNLPEPVRLDPVPTLLIFGFDNQQKSHLENNILPKIINEGVRCYYKGNMKTAQLATIYKV